MKITFPALNRPDLLAFAVVLPLVGQGIAAQAAAGDFAFTELSNRLAITHAGSPVAEFVFRDEKIFRPHLANVHAPGGFPATRHHPPIAGADAMDHDTMHPGIWLAFGDINGQDFWRNKARMEHVRFSEPPRVAGGRLAFASECLLRATSGAIICTLTNRLSFASLTNAWLLVWEAAFHSDTGDITFGDQEEMGFGVRVATGITEKAGGCVTSSTGLKTAKSTWGQPAEWCDYSGKVGGTEIGITLLANPVNFRPSWWHNRDYGLMVANPFGREAMKQGAKSAVTVKRGETFRLRFAAAIHARSAGNAQPLPYRDYLQELTEPVPEAARAEAPSAKAVAFYYPWYGNPQTDGRYANWNHPVAVRNEPPRAFPGGDDIGANFYPALGCYSANDPEVVREHMRQLRQAGVGVLCASWWGKDTFTDRALPGLFRAAEAEGLKVNFHIEPFAGRNAITTREAIAYLIGKFGASPACHRLPERGSRPVFFVYDSYLTPAQEWAEVFAEKGSRTLRGNENDAVVIGLWVKEHEERFMLEGGFDGFYTYFATDGFTYGSTLRNWQRLADWARANQKLFVPCVAPGYIDTRIRPWNGVNTRDREAGAYYDRMWSAALAVTPELVGITSFNEWHEGTQIESAAPKAIPGFNYLDYQPLAPDYYLNRTAHWVRNLTAK